MDWGINPATLPVVCGGENRVFREQNPAPHNAVCCFEFSPLYTIGNQPLANHVAKPCILPRKTQHIGSQNAAYCRPKPSILQNDMLHTTFKWRENGMKYWWVLKITTVD